VHGSSTRGHSAQQQAQGVRAQAAAAVVGRMGGAVPRGRAVARVPTLRGDVSASSRDDALRVLRAAVRVGGGALVAGRALGAAAREAGNGCAREAHAMTAQLHDWQAAGRDAMGVELERCACCGVMRHWPAATQPCPDHDRIARERRTVGLRPQARTALPAQAATCWPGPYRDELPRRCVGCGVQFTRPVAMRRCDYCGPACAYRARRASITASQHRQRSQRGPKRLKCAECQRRFAYDKSLRRLQYCGEACAHQARLKQQRESDRRCRAPARAEQRKCS
jgi:hypothetical protein